MQGSDRQARSPRQLLADAAEAATVAVGGVADLAPGATGGAVSATAQADGRYELRILVAAREVPLPDLADEIRAAVAAAASGAGLQDELGSIDVEIRDIVAGRDLQ